MGQWNSMWPCRGSSVDTKLSKCSNSGALTINASGLDSKSSDISAFGIISGNTKKVTSCKNSGKITVKVKNCNSSSLTDGITVAGLCEVAEKLTFCSNTGKISLESCDIRGEIGVAGMAAQALHTVSKCYNTGSITVSTGKFNDRNYKDVGGLIGRGVSLDNASFSQCYNKGTITVSTKASGASEITWKDWTANATKVSKITKSKCPKLSSTYWTYSSKLGRMILKNNKEK